MLNLTLVTTICVVVALSSSLAASQGYTTLETLGVACADHRDSCQFARSRNFTLRNCECDRNCAVHNDCCIDSPFRQSTEASQRARQRQPCLAYSDDAYIGAYMMNQCPPTYTNQEVKSKCQNVTDIREPLLAAPVTDTNSRVTYKNRFCAECHGAPSASLKSWLIVNQCPNLTNIDNVNATFVWKNIRFDNAKRKWGVDIGGNFHVCNIWFSVPDYLNRSVRSCRARLVSRCRPNWTRAMVKTNCESYEAVVYNGDRAYKNAHCAICNGESVVNLQCTRPEVTSRGRRPFAFGMLLDVNTMDGNEVGAITRCPANQKYDPYFKKCRPLSCVIPGYEERNGRCVKM